MKDPILVVGGAGYIGSHMVKMLAQAGHRVVVLDNLCTGFADAARYGTLVEGDLADSALLDRLFGEQHFAAVLHFAALSQVGESMQIPARYYRNNVANTLNLLDAMDRHGVRSFLFSSTAAIFGEPEYTPIDEAHPTRPINPYGRSKRMVEEMLGDLGRSQGLRAVCLRYFNAAGADPEGELGERHDPESHLIPLVLQAASGRRPQIAVFGSDYDTPDGTCIRDYIHVWDLCSAHLLALEHLLDGGASLALNLGNGLGFSVQEVIDTARRVTGKDIPVRAEARRPGDPAILVADSQQARSTLGWQPQYAELDTIIAHAWAWEQQKGKCW
ncbi:UDP-glucose 4-epimerase GalE [Candidatus Igneacidithiobacillus taiwanensis]|uniref:UDP-glucose 4-epimerase GalE n=1 Tax=Candidatus Igneacidithiobacillus taiwanensis TaxID=1945924 RepID=UPI0028A0602B|nr:UDP-glucose 4-epimerase GalE [Candidatus Igneacidithiobacillus taiwanensis]MCE5360301.1 UDP-glucose 4-epimerase GalE [Acidithiobacillus sp.]